MKNLYPNSHEQTVVSFPDCRLLRSYTWPKKDPLRQCSSHVSVRAAWDINGRTSTFLQISIAGRLNNKVKFPSEWFTQEPHGSKFRFRDSIYSGTLLNIKSVRVVATETADPIYIKRQYVFIFPGNSILSFTSNKPKMLSSVFISALLASFAAASVDCPIKPYDAAPGYQIACVYGDDSGVYENRLVQNIDVVGGMFSATLPFECVRQVGNSESETG